MLKQALRLSVLGVVVAEEEELRRKRLHLSVAAMFGSVSVVGAVFLQMTRQLRSCVLVKVKVMKAYPKYMC
jgi:RNA-binding protein YhbY